MSSRLYSLEFRGFYSESPTSRGVSEFYYFLPDFHTSTKRRYVPILQHENENKNEKENEKLHQLIAKRESI
jgi:hypothetical protein